MTRFLRLLVSLAALALAAHAAGRWRVQYLHEADDSHLAIYDLAFASPQRGLAVGTLTAPSGKSRPVALTTRDGGEKWEMLRLPDEALSVFLLNESLGWIAGPKGVWRTEEFGRNWTKLKSPKGVIRVYFKDPLRGWAIGRGKSASLTTDGGRSWRDVPEAEKPGSTPTFTVYNWIEFMGDRGLISGYSRPPRRDAGRFPDWMDPEKARRRRERPGLGILLQTRDGGKNWDPSTTTMFGHVTRVRLATDGRGLGLIEFFDAFDWPSEVLRLDWKTGRSERVFRQKDRAVTDVALVPGGPAYLAAVEPPGQLSHGIPGKLKLLESDDLAAWREMNVDYRAVAERATLAVVDAANVWVATDTGMILKLVPE